MLGGGSDGAHDAPDSGEKQAIFMQFAGKERAYSLALVYRAAVVTRRAVPQAVRRDRRRRRSSGGGGIRPSRLREAARQGRRGRAAAPAPRTVRRCPSQARPSRSCRCRPSCRRRRGRLRVVVFAVVSGGARDRLRGRRLGRRRRAGRRVAAARVGLALLRKRERTTDLFLGVRVVEDVGRKLRDRLLVAMERVDLADPAVVVPVRDHEVGTTLRLRQRRLAANRRRDHHECDEQETEAQGAVEGEGSNHDAERAGCPVPEECGKSSGWR